MCFEKTFIGTFTGNKYITTIIYRIQAYNSIICGYFYIGFIAFMLKGKSLLDYKNLFSPNGYEKNVYNNNEIFSITKKDYILLFEISIENLRNLKPHIS